MKKLLLGTTAIVAAAAVAAPAVAAEKINLGLGGYMEQYIGYASNERDAGVREYRKFDTQSDTEIWVQGSTTLDNGLKFSVRMEIEADGEDTAGTIDESYVDITSPSFGALKLGYDDIVTALAAVRAPDYGPSMGDSRMWIPAAGVQERHDIYTSVGTGDEAKITYFTPRFFGFQAGASYVPEFTDRETSGAGAGNSSNNGFMPNSVNGGGDAWAAVVNYRETFGGFGVAADVGYARASGGQRRANGVNGVAAVTDTGVRSIEGYQAGLLLSFAGFEIGAAWENTNINAAPGYNYSASQSGAEHIGWEGGIGYKSGPWGVSLGVQHGETTAGIGSGIDPDKNTTYALSGLYNLGPGIDVQGAFYLVDYDRDSSATDASYNDGGWAVVTGVRLSF